MKIFVVVSSRPYEGEEFHAVCATLERAIQRAKWEMSTRSTGAFVTDGERHARGVRWQAEDGFETVEVREVGVLT